MLLLIILIGVVVIVLFIEFMEFDCWWFFLLGDVIWRMCELYVFILLVKLNLLGKLGYGCLKNFLFVFFGFCFFEVFLDLVVVVCFEVEWCFLFSGCMKWGFGIGFLKIGLGFLWKNGL